MAQRSDQSANQLSKEDQKVDPKFWAGRASCSKNGELLTLAGDVGVRKK